MITLKIGDGIRLDEKYLKTKSIDLQRNIRDKFKRSGNVIRTIDPCSNGCEGCPGLVNGGCWKYGGQYMLGLETNKFEGKYSF